MKFSPLHIACNFGHDKVSNFEFDLNAVEFEADK